ncbi:MAG: pyroglutamyl-peptidase I [Bacillota bacterium]|nr:pyroglutamyl-peptidase I [Bacillota bacterium]
MKLLLTGFEPFLDFMINPSAEIAKELDGQQVGNYKIISRILPVDFSEAAHALSRFIDEVNPDAVISLGLAGGRNRITPERIAINCNDGVKDNRGFTPQDQKIAEDGPDGYFSKLPIRKFVQILQENGYPAEISNSAGTYLCNNVMYHLLHKMNMENKDCPAGFVHIPSSHELALTSPNLPSWSQRDLTEAVKLIVTCL